jgi:hypothetical protein
MFAAEAKALKALYTLTYVKDACANSSGSLARGLAVARRLCCLDFHGVDVRHATSSAFKDILPTTLRKLSIRDIRKAFPAITAAPF